MSAVGKTRKKQKYMYQSALTSRYRVVKRNQNVSRYQPIAKSLGPISNALFVAMMVVILGVLYLTQITKTSAFGYQVDELKNTRAALIEENEQLEVQAARLQALERIKDNEVARSLSDIGQIDYSQQ